MSQIYYKFKSSKDFNSIVFDGTSINLFELKKLIILQAKLKGNDFDISIYNAQTNEGNYIKHRSGTLGNYVRYPLEFPPTFPDFSRLIITLSI